MDQRPHIIVVEDEATQRQLLVDYLDKQNFRVSAADGGGALRRLVERELPALVLLDVGLPGEDGFALARWLREKSGRIGIIMVTAAADTVDRVVGLETGADDYIGKPYEPRELLARIKSLLRRVTGAPAASGPRVRMGRRVLDLEKRLLVDPGGGGEELLTASEYDLLKVFAENPNRPLTRDWLLEVTAHREMEAFDRAIDLRITRLRRKIEVDPAHPDAIRTVRGVGYMFVPPKDRGRVATMNASASSFDVVVVGCGIAGLSAAATALQAGRRVAVIERAPKDERGGNSRWTEALLRMKSEREVSDDFETHFASNAG